MKSIARLSFVLFLIFSVTSFGCAVFPGQQEDSGARQTQERSSARIILPATDPVESNSKSESEANFIQDLPPWNSSSNARAIPQSDNPIQREIRAQAGVRSLDELTSEPSRDNGPVRAERIKMAQDEVPFGGVRTASHFAIEPKRMPASLQPSSVNAITKLTISDSVDGSKINWPILSRELAIPILGQTFNIEFDPTDAASATATTGKLLVQVNGELFDKSGVAIVKQVTAFSFIGTWAAGDTIDFKIGQQQELVTIAAPTAPATVLTVEQVIDQAVSQLRSSTNSEFTSISWEKEVAGGQFKLQASAKTAGVGFTIDPTETSGNGDIGAAENIAGHVIAPGVAGASVKNLPVGVTSEIKLWLTSQITASTLSQSPLFIFKVSSPSLEPERPVLVKAGNTKYLDLDKFNANTIYKLYGSRPYLRLEGRNGTPASNELQFVLRDNSGNEIDVTADAVKVETINATQGTWKAELQLSKNLSARAVDGFGRLFVLRTKNAKHNYAINAIKFNTFETPADLTLPPELTAKVKEPATEVNGVFLTNQSAITLTGPTSDNETVPSEVAVVATKNGKQMFLNATRGKNDWEIPIAGLEDGRHDLTVDMMVGETSLGAAATIPVFVRTEGPKVLSVKPPNFGTAPGAVFLTIEFNPENPLDADKLGGSVDEKIAPFGLFGSLTGSTVFTGVEKRIAPKSAEFLENSNSIKLEFTGLPANIYQLQIAGDKIRDVYGNSLVGDNGQQGTLFTKTLVESPPAASTASGTNQVPLTKLVVDESPTVTPGISGSTGDYVAFAEFAQRPPVPDGFNPNDKVETRVVRLYYYRDAHRIAQIVNRKVKSYNRAAVDTSRQLADKARNQASELTVIRQNAERNAIILAKKTRRKESELQQAENTLNGSLQQLTNYRREKPDFPAGEPSKQSDPATIKQLETLIGSLSQTVKDLRAQVQDLRDAEIQANEQTQQAQAQEKLAREEQFRREVAAAHTDPDTYAPGVPTSKDPIEQVSVSVVGEGLIQLRGPLKGINLIRMAIDQLDAPIGQVRVSLHTIQINGERADRMEVVAEKVQTYIDHARFLTMQSSEMLRKAVVQVASRKAEEASGLFPGATQMDRDERYIMAFFGKDFIDELKAMDSEFLHTGNKLLSLHSMDTTSLASALNLMALAKNSTRQEIFAAFDDMLQRELPQKEQNYFAAGWTCPKKRKNCLHNCKLCRCQCDDGFCLMSGNAKFESLRGFFDMQIANDDTMTPLQREFIRLAQIFKSRLITEMEYKQRVMERAIIEERLGDRMEELKAAKYKEDVANQALDSAKRSLVNQKVALITSVKGFDLEIKNILRVKLVETLKAMDNFKKVTDQLASYTANIGTNPNGSVTLDGMTVKLTLVMPKEEKVEFSGPNPELLADVQGDLLSESESLYNLLSLLASLHEPTENVKIELDALRSFVAKLKKFKIQIPRTDFGDLTVQSPILDYITHISDPRNQSTAALVVNGYANNLSASLDNLLTSLLDQKKQNSSGAFTEWLDLKFDFFTPVLDSPFLDSQTKAKLATAIEPANTGFRAYLENSIQKEFAVDDANDSRRPLDHKKFLDMLVDDLEEKHIELLDGTRAHVANIDNYLKRVITALDDDFNTQFYYPAMKYIRESTVSYDVQFGQTESTTLLANNREFAKADPSATMEFDLPQRDILLTEGFKAGKAVMNDVGALANDPTFLAMASLGGPASTAFYNRGASGGNGVVRNVLPGLNSTTSEQVMSQNSNGGQQFGSNMENLIPDPAVYKFETGTGFEIRPVIQPDGQAVVFDFNYMYTSNIREPVRADEKHLGRVKRHYVDTDVQLSNFEMREVSRYNVALKAARTSRGVPLLEDVPGVGALFRPLPSDESSLQQNLIMAQATIFPTLFDLMGLRWAPVLADLDPMALSDSDFIVRNRHKMLENRVYDQSSSYVDEFLRVPEGERRMDLYRSQNTIPNIHPNGYMGRGMNLQNSEMEEGYQPNRVSPAQPFVPSQSIEGAPNRTYRQPSQEFYEDQRSSGPPNPYGIRDPGAIGNRQGK